ncbi:MAG: hypothetical protein DBP02_01830 [gamma proteobacterium symbiont of Ctena orbiculata]|nr:MAG: hypothetical protein DBP02_01830 [gamma proteobacterium symbiont of Ctena orbiculata]
MDINKYNKHLPGRTRQEPKHSTRKHGGMRHLQIIISQPPHQAIRAPNIRLQMNALNIVYQLQFLRTGQYFLLLAKSDKTLNWGDQPAYSISNFMPA